MRDAIYRYMTQELEIDDAEVIGELLAQYIVTLEEYCVRLDAILAARDYAGMRSVAHAVKGCSANIGAMAVAAAAVELSSAAKAENDRAAAEVVQTLKQQCEALKQS